MTSMGDEVRGQPRGIPGQSGQSGQSGKSGHWQEAVRLADPDATRAAGEALAALLRPGDVVVLAGDLGAGKTTLTQGIGAGLQVRGPITSPTFVIARVHPSLRPGGGPALVHVDAYRLGSALEFDDLDLDADLAESVVVVEWGEGLVEGLAGDRLHLRLGIDGDARWLTITPVGARWQGQPGLVALARALPDPGHGTDG